MIKIEHDKDISAYHAVEIAKKLINLYEHTGTTSTTDSQTTARITQVSKAGNIFIHVAKTSE